MLHRVVEEPATSTSLPTNSSPDARRSFIVELGGVVIPVHPDFGAIVLCQVVGRAIHFAAKCTVINFAHSDEKIFEILCNHLIEYLHPDLYSVQQK